MHDRGLHVGVIAGEHAGERYERSSRRAHTRRRTHEPACSLCRLRPLHGFTLIELLVVISIIALLVGILLPALGAARESAKGSQSLSKLRQIAIALSTYSAERKGYFPIHSSTGPSLGGTKPRWADYLFPFVPDERAYLSPNLDGRELGAGFTKVFWHQVSSTGAEAAEATNAGFALSPMPSDPKRHGGYGYNFQYLGNARAGVRFNGRDTQITSASSTVGVGDVTGSRNGSSGNEPGDGGAAVYAIDPPLGSARGSGKGSYYEGGSDENDGSNYAPDFKYVWRSAPAERNSGSANMAFIDGHAQSMRRSEVDDHNSDGKADNGYWNGWGDANRN